MKLCCCCCCCCCFSFTVTHPNFKYAHNLITDAIIIAIISFVINISQAKLLAKKNGYTVHPDQVSEPHTTYSWL